MQTSNTAESTMQRIGSRFLRLPEVSSRTGLRKTAIYDWVKAKRFPAPVRLSARAIVWLESDIELWIADHVSAAKAA